MKTMDSIIENALLEDMPEGDVTSEALFSDETSEAWFLSKATGVVSGLDVAKRVYERVDSTLVFEAFVENGDPVYQKTRLAKVSGKTKSILKGERVALNLLQRMSGIATATHALVSAVSGFDCTVLDTRKTAPNLRLLDKKAVVHGGGKNHRFSLSDMVLIKDNHIQAAGSIAKAVKKARAHVRASMEIEVEIETMAQFEEALETSAERIMLDNMSHEAMRGCVEKNNGKKILEASGNMTLNRARDVARTGVDCISVGAITHSVNAFDISLTFGVEDDNHE